MKKNKKTIDTLVQDIYQAISPLTENKQIKVNDEDIDKFGKAMASALKHWATPQPRDTSTLRMSNIGKPSRQLWYDLNAEQAPQQLASSTLIKFLYGHLLEELVLFFVKNAATEYNLHQALARFLSGRTTLIIAHRLSAVKQADRVLVFDGGHIAEDGDHQQLIADGGLYAKLYGHLQQVR